MKPCSFQMNFEVMLVVKQRERRQKKVRSFIIILWPERNVTTTLSALLASLRYDLTGFSWRSHHRSLTVVWEWKSKVTIICYSHPTPENIPKAKVAHKTMLLTKISVKIRNKTEAYYIALNKQGVRDPLFQIFPLMGRCTSFYPQYNQDLTEVRAFFLLLKE